ncbi:hypothetical protein SRCM101060_02722 [Lactiplantibacillus plantarum]|nr:hypothetical protein SRCM101060_02722 [Lactiplantibacillus plantarum]
MSIQRLPDWHQIEQPVVILLKTARHHLWGNVAVYFGPIYYQASRGTLGPLTGPACGCL